MPLQLPTYRQAHLFAQPQNKIYRFRSIPIKQLSCQIVYIAFDCSRCRNGRPAHAVGQ